MLKEAKIIKHEITIEYECPNLKQRYSSTIENPFITQGQYYEDWEYTAINFMCPHCGMSHVFEI